MLSAVMVQLNISKERLSGAEESTKVIILVLQLRQNAEEFDAMLILVPILNLASVFRLKCLKVLDTFCHFHTESLSLLLVDENSKVQCYRIKTIVFLMYLAILKK